MNTYRVTIEETLKMTVEVEAQSREEAEAEAERRWINSDYVLNADNFTGVTFRASRKPPDRDMKR